MRSAERPPNPWTRKGLYYQVSWRFYNKAPSVHRHQGRVKYFFSDLSLLILRWIHGEDELIRLGQKPNWRIK